MKLYPMLSGLALVLASVATPAAASSIAPTATNFTANGNAVLDKTGYPTQFCVLTLTGNSGDGVNGSISGGTNTGGGFCSLITVDSSPFTITGTLNPTTVQGSISSLVVRLNGTVICSEANRLFTADTSGNINFASTIAPDCNVSAALNTTDVWAVP